MNIMQKLVEFGLSEKEATIYITLLQIGEGSIVDIAAHSLIKRPTIYSGIESLEKKELVYGVTKGKRVRYKAKSPGELTHILKRREVQLQTLIPQLEEMAQIAPRRSEHGIRYVEGKAAVIALYRELFSQQAQKEPLYIFSALQNVRSNFPELLSLFDQTHLRWKWHIREIIPNESDALDQMRQSQKSSAHHPRLEIRVLPTGYDLIDSECLLFNDRMILLSLQSPVYTIALSDVAFTASFRALFDAAWRLAVPLRRQ